MHPTSTVVPASDSLDDGLMNLQTPCYVYDPTVVMARYAQLRERLGSALIVSLKANPNLDLLIRCGHAFVDGIELASQGELDLVAGRIHAPKYVNNPSMDESFMRAALASRCIFIIDSLEQARRLIQVVGRQPAPQTVLRLNAGELLGQRQGADHFGLGREDAAVTAQTLTQAGFALIGLHVFAGSRHFRADDSGRDSADLAHALARMARSLSAITHAPLTFLNLGGGFAEHSDAHPDTFERYRQRLNGLQGEFTLAHESGRALFADAGTFVTQVRSVKVLGDRYVAVCDGGLSHNFLLARTESPLKQYAQPRLLRRPAAALASVHRPIQFVGSTCSRADVIGWHPQPSAAPCVGDRVVFDGCGAYHQSYSVSGFLSQSPAHTYLRQS